VRPARSLSRIAKARTTLCGSGNHWQHASAPPEGADSDYESEPAPTLEDLARLLKLPHDRPDAIRYLLMAVDRRRRVYAVGREAVTACGS
jgi:hypothetical protein